MRLLILPVLLLTLTAGMCSTPGVETPEVTPISMPALPAQLARPAQRLPDITDPSLGGAHIQGAQDDQQYNAVASQLNTIIRAWDCVRQALITRTDPNQCLNRVNP